MNRRPTHNLDAFRRAMAQNLRWTGVARAGADALGFAVVDVKSTVASMKPGMFCKSMPSEKRPGQMQDVYHVPSRVGLLYVKFTDEGIAEFVLLSFKRK
ncbi:MAG: type II toxin-antitoxin system MqsR family toxin [Myxococcota bacterium]